MVTQHHGDFVYVGDALRDNDAFLLSSEEAHHLARVRRKREGQHVFATDGNGGVFEGTFEPPNTLRIEREHPAFGESPMRMTLICGCILGDSARDVVNCAVQLGVRTILWTRMAYSQELYSGQRLERLHRVAIQTLKQTGRAFLPNQTVIERLDEALDLIERVPLFVAHPTQFSKKETAIYLSDSAALIVGPEGGFAEAELTLLHEHGAVAVTLSNRRLRTETAVAAGLAFLLTRSGEFSL